MENKTSDRKENSKETIKIRAEITETETSKTIEKNKWNKDHVFETTSKIHKLLSRLTKKKREGIDYKYLGWKGTSSTDLTDMKRKIRKHLNNMLLTFASSDTVEQLPQNTDSTSYPTWNAADDMNVPVCPVASLANFTND